MKLALIKKKLIKSIITLGTAVMTGTLAFTSAVAWFNNIRDAKPNISASVHASYFAGGDGSAENPFQINLPVQLYYFAWLQDLGVFNTDEDGTLNQIYFELTSNIDMTGYNLPPIGTPKYPFVGNFDGNGYKVSNLTVSNIEGLTDTPATEEDVDGFQIVGFFGVVGSLEDTNSDDNADTILIGSTTYSYSSAANEVKDFLLDNVKIQSTNPEDDRTLAGIAVGYLNGNISGVGLYNCSMEFGADVSVLDSGNITDKLSGYSLIGFSRTAYEAYTEHQGGTGSDFGGSLDMEGIHARLTSIYNAQSNRTITYRQTAYMFYDENNQYVDLYQTGTTTANYRVYDSDTSAGSFMFAMYSNSGGTSNYFYYINGGIRTTVSREYYYSDSTAYRITDSSGTYYLAPNEGYTGVEASTAEADWFNTNTTRYYVQKINIPSNDPITQEYLNKDNYGRLTLSTSYLAWTRNGTSMYNDGEYIVHVNGANGGFGLTDNAYVRKIAYDGNYLVTNGSTLTSGNSSAATEWLVSNNYVHTVLNNTTYYLNRSGDNGVAISTTPSTQWTVSGNSLKADNGNYLQYINGAWTLNPYTSYIVDASGNYLTASGANLTNTTSQNSATQWSFSNEASGGYIYYTNNGTTYYLRNNNGVLETTTSTSNRTSWTISNNQITYNNQSIQYINGYWSLARSNYSYTIGDGSGNYLTFDGSSFGNTTTAANATVWYFSNGASGGTMSATLNGTTYYLYNNNGSLSTTTNANNATSWAISNNVITNNNYYLQYRNGSWDLTQFISYIVDASGNYLTLNGANITNTTSQGSATVWEFSNGASGGTISYRSGNTTYYLRNNNGLLETTTNSGNATSWTIADNKIANNNLSIQYINGYWSLARANYSYTISSSGNYLTFDGSSFGNTTTAGNATVWYLSSGANGGTISAYINGTMYYLYNNNGTLAYTTTAGNATSWTIEDNYIFNDIYYLLYNSGSWKLSAFESYIVDASGNYLILNGANLANTTSQGSAIKWTFSEGNDGGIISYKSGNTTYYLRNNSGVLTTTTTANQATTWTVANNRISSGDLSIQCINNYWVLAKENYTFNINDGSGNYLTFNGSAFDNTTTAANATVWNISNGSSGGTISVTLNGTMYYLYNNNGTLAYTTTAGNATSWTIADNQISDGNYYIAYDSTWKINVFSYYTINDGSGHYLSVSGGNIQPTNEASATTWLVSNGMDGGIISYTTGVTTYYLRNNDGTLELTTNSGNATNWTNDNGQLYNGSYTVQYDSTEGWYLQAEGTLISQTSGNTTYYLTYNGNTLTYTTSKTQAKTWNFSDATNKKGTISTAVGTTYYLTHNTTTLSLTNASGSATNWRNDNGVLYDTGTTYNDGPYYINYSSGWRCTLASNYYLYDENTSQYLVAPNNTGNCTASTTKATRYWQTSGNYVASTYGTNYRLNYSNNNNNGTVRVSNTTTRAFQYNNGYLQFTYNNTTYYLYYSSGWKRTNSTSSRHTFARVPYNGTALTIADVVLSDLTFTPVVPTQTGVSAYSFKNITISSEITTLTTTAYSLKNITVSSLLTALTRSAYSLKNISISSLLQTLTVNSTTTNISTSTTTAKLYNYRTSNFQFSEQYFIDYDPDHINYGTTNTGTWASYFPINADASNGYQAINSNTGYIVGGTYERRNPAQQSGDTQTDQYFKKGDIRISEYEKNTAAGSGRGTGFVANQVLTGTNYVTVNDAKVRTINGSGDNYITPANYIRYADAKAGYETILEDSSNKSYVYGLHFMNASIDVNNIVTAKHVLINGETHDNYQLAASSIDFALKKKGYITFFAGTYFSGNDSFFSLHKITRDPETLEITDIRKIEAIYGTTDSEYADFRNFIYAYEDASGNTYYEYSNGTALGDGETIQSLEYELLFNTDWIEKQNSLSTGYLYFFEVPADPGEYALGSVDGGTGAYLLYLDIAANAGDVDTEVMDYIKGVDFVASNTDYDLSYITSDTGPIAAIAIKDIYAAAGIGTITFTRTDTYTDGVLTAADLQVINTADPTSGTSPAAYVRHYVDTSGDVTITVTYVPAGSGG